jgi:hypothetical protein
MRAVGIAFAVVVVVLLAWIAGESHYQACIARAEATTPEIGRIPSVQQQLGGASAPNNAERVQAVEGCSRLP